MNIYPGMKVANDQGPLGLISEVGTDPRTGVGFVVIRGEDGQLSQAELSSFTVEHDVLLLSSSSAQAAGQTGATSAQHSRTETQVIIPSAAELRAEATHLAPGQEIKVPVIAEQAVVEKRQVEGGGVRVHKTVHERQEIVEQEITRQEVEVYRVAVNRYVETPPGIREQGDTTIIPVLEEVLVVEKRLLLKEEIHLIRRRTTETQHVDVTLREEQVELEDLDGLNNREIGH